jgi:NADPH:quinone reductase
MPDVNRQIVLAARPSGVPQESDFRLVESPVPRPGAGEALMRNLYLSLDPYLRGRTGAPLFNARVVEIGDVMSGAVVAEVLDSNDPRAARGDIVSAMLGWQDYAVAPAKSLRKIDPGTAPVTTALYVLGMPGLTAYFGLLDVCRPQPGETVAISGAAGAVGSLVGQIARIKRCRAIGIAGGAEKIRYLTQELGFDGALDHRRTPDLHAQLKELCPNGIDIYFDNVGGAITDAVMRQLNVRARVAVCGQSSLSNSEEPDVGPRWLSQLVLRQAKVEGFLVGQFSDRYEEAYRQLSTWLRDRRLKYHEEVAEGLEDAPRAFVAMLQGRGMGKQLVKVAQEAESLPLPAAGSTMTGGHSSL